jgi:hypothetical protein
VRNVLSSWGLNVGLEVKTDASAAKGICSRRGCGKIRHIEVRELWLQERVASGEIRVTKIPRAVNLSDCLTHHVSSSEVGRSLESMAVVVSASRHELAPHIGE